MYLYVHKYATFHSIGYLVVHNILAVVKYIGHLNLTLNVAECKVLSNDSSEKMSATEHLHFNAYHLHVYHVFHNERMLTIGNRRRRG